VKMYSHNYRKHFKKEKLPSPAYYYRSQGLVLKGGGEWKTALCPFHHDTKPSLRLRFDSGGFVCMACGMKGGDILEFHRKKYKLSFREAARQLGAWEEQE
ncbi:MAG: hypothetical protein GY821_00110, partial [Gammaproteobacteria bacterium]|nr:hypothetical protein [Gammaproteobacteria bacterium]